jgi:peptide/nickel transport system ATP-binding protein
MSTAPSHDIVLDVKDLQTVFFTNSGLFKAVDSLSFKVRRGETLAIVGESGCGKSVSALSVMRLVPDPPGRIVGGKVLFEGKDLLGLDETGMRDVRGNRISMIFQEPMTSLNPVMRIGDQITEAVRLHQAMTTKQAWEKAVEMLRLVRIPEPARRAQDYPHQLSGGMRQRAMIAMAMLFTPELVIMDEPTSALDVVAQRSLMVQIKELQEAYRFAVIFVTHDMSLISHFSDRLMVMYAGQVSELGATRTVFDAPRHPYTQGLLEAFPSIRGAKVPLKGIPGSPPNLAMIPNGCRFHPRCPVAFDRCSVEAPDLYQQDGSLVRCLLYDDTASGSSSPAPTGGRADA